MFKLNHDKNANVAESGDFGRRESLAQKKPNLGSMLKPFAKNTDRGDSIPKNQTSNVSLEGTFGNSGVRAPDGSKPMMGIRKPSKPKYQPSMLNVKNPPLVEKPYESNKINLWDKKADTGRSGFEGVEEELSDEQNSFKRTIP